VCSCRDSQQAIEGRPTDVCVDAENVVTTARERDGQVRDDVSRFVALERAGDEESRPVVS